MTEPKATYSDLPVCKLCDKPPRSHIVEGVIKPFCGNSECVLYWKLFTESEWRKLMGEPKAVDEPVKIYLVDSEKVSDSGRPLFERHFSEPNILDYDFETLYASPQKSEWVSVEDRLPEYQCRAGSDSFVFVLGCVNGLVSEFMYANGKWQSTGLGKIDVTPTHWMEIPKPPEQPECQ